MPKRLTSVILRCEDLQQRCFLYRFLAENGFRAHDIRIEHSPHGDAKQWVRRQHAIETRALRRKPHLSIGLITMLDADDRTIQDRKKELDAALADIGEGPRQPSERIAVLVPRRNIETWIHRLQGEEVNEENSYPRFRGEERRCAPAVREFVRRCPTSMTTSDPPSLRDGCEELTRFLSRQKAP